MLALAKGNDFAQIGAEMTFDVQDVFCDHASKFAHNCSFQSHYSKRLGNVEDKCTGKTWWK